MLKGLFRCTARPQEEGGGARASVLVPEPATQFRFISAGPSAIQIAMSRVQDSMFFKVGHRYEITVKDVTS